MTASDVARMVREATDEEVAFYLEHGWVMLRGLIAPELAEELRRVAEAQVKRDPKLGARLAMNPDAEPFPSLVFSEVMCRNAERFINRKSLNDEGVPIRYGGDGVGIKGPGVGERAFFHQDACEHGSDRAGETRFWIALVEVTAEMGPMCFVDRSHRDGPLGSTDPGGMHGRGGRDLLDLFPKLKERVTPPMEYNVGDATVHHAYMAHCFGVPNTTDQLRVSYAIDYHPLDVRFINGKLGGNIGAQRRRLDDEEYPIIYPREPPVVPD